MNTQFAAQLGSDEVYPQHLDKGFPHIVTKMLAHWQDATFLAYVDSLLFDERGDRAGFSPDILEEIFILQHHYRSRQPPRPISIDTWADAVALPKKHPHE